MPRRGCRRRRDWTACGSTPRRHGFATRPRRFGPSSSPATGPGFLRGLGWLQGVRPESLDAQSRAGVALAAASLPAAQRQERLAAILAAQNGDGGFGAGGDFASDGLDMRSPCAP